MSERIFELREGGVLVGTLYEYSLDFPWVLCRFEPTPSFAGLEALFAEEMSLLRAEKWHESQLVYMEIERRVKLIYPDDPSMIAAFVLHIDGDQAWFRYRKKRI
jgi:hypothetical protein